MMTLTGTTSHTSTTLLLLLVVVVLVSSYTVSATVTVFCPPGLDAKILDPDTYPECKDSYDEVRTKVLPICLAAGRAATSVHVVEIKEHVDAYVAEGGGERKRKLHDAINKWVADEDAISMMEDNDHHDEEGTFAEVTPIQHRFLAEAPKGCPEEYVDQCMGTKSPHPACCIMCKFHWCSIMGGSRRRRLTNELNVEEEVQTGDELEKFAEESDLTMEKYVAFTDTLCSFMFQTLGDDDNKCFGSDPSMLQCTTSVVL